MKLIIFQTNINSKHHIKTLQSVFNDHDHILDWSIDIEDIDNVLRIEANDELHDSDVINLIGEHGFYCDHLEG